MKKPIVKKYNNQKFERIIVGNIGRKCRIDKVEEELWIVSNDHLCYGADVEFTVGIAELLAKKIKDLKADYLLVAASKPLAMAYELAKKLGHKNIAIARKNISPLPPLIVETNIRSITGKRKEKLMLDGETAKRIKNKKVILFDDTISTGNTMQGLKKLAELSKAEVVAVACVWIEGASVFKLFKDEFKNSKLFYLSVFPLFAIGETYTSLLKEIKEFG